MSFNPERLDDAPTPGELLQTAITNMFEAYEHDIIRGGIVRQFEEELILDAPPGFIHAPLATRLVVTRPIPGQEEQAARKWNAYGGNLISIYEFPGKSHIQTDYRVVGDDVEKRQLTILRKQHDEFGQTDRNTKIVINDEVAELLTWLNNAVPAKLHPPA